MLLWVTEERSLDWKPGETPFAAAREAQLEKLGDLVADHVDREALMRLIDEGRPSGLPVVRGQLVSNAAGQQTVRWRYAERKSVAYSPRRSLGYSSPCSDDTWFRRPAEQELMADRLIAGGAAEAGRLLLLTTADTEILAAAKASERLPEGFPKLLCANPVGLDDPAAFFERELPGAGAVLVRLLGGRRAWPEGLEELRRRCARLRVPLLAFGGEAEPDAELTALSTVPSGTVLEAFEYLRHGGVRNTENLLRFVADTVLIEGYGFEPASPLPEVGVYRPGLPEGSTGEELLARHDPARPTVGVIFYRAHWMSGNTAFVDALVEALEAAGADALPAYCYSLRAGPDGRVPGLELLKDRVDCLVTTVLAGGGSNAADARVRARPKSGWSGTSLHSKSWASPSCRASARPRRGRPGSLRTPASPHSTQHGRWPYRSSTAGSSGSPSPSKNASAKVRPSAPRSPSTKPPPNVPRASQASRLASPDSGVSRTRRRESPFCSPTTRPSTRG